MKITLNLNIYRFITLVFITITLSAATSNASLTLGISNSEIPKTNLMILGFKSSDPSKQDDVEKIIDQINSNLTTTNLFNVINRSNNPQLITINGNSSTLLTEKAPDFNAYNAINIGAILIADINFDDELNMEVRIRLWDILDEKQLFGKFYSTNQANYKQMSNLISDEIFKAITGEKIGHFNSKIVYVAESGESLRRTKRLASMDFDGSNHQYLTNGRNLVLTPIFSKKDNQIIFLRYFNNKAQIYNLNTENGALSKIGNFHNTTLTPSAHPKNPNLILFSLIEHGNSGIYEINLATNRVSRITTNPAIDTTPSYSPDGERIVFASDRDGSQKIYTMNIDGSDVRKVTREKGSYSKPVWSPDGNMIAFTKIRKNVFYIGLISPNGRNEKNITKGYLIEGAKWSPNGRYIIYSRKDGPYGKKSIPKLYIIDIVTGFERELETPLDEGATDPDWAIN